PSIGRLWRWLITPYADFGHSLAFGYTRTELLCPFEAVQYLAANSAHCGLMPASRMTFPHFAVSVLNCAAHSSGVLPTGSKPSVAIRSFMAGSAIALAVSRWSSGPISLGVRAGTMMANHASPSMPG